MKIKNITSSNKFRNGVFPTFGFIVLAIGIVWFLNEINIFNIELPWIPIILIVIAIGWIVNYYTRKQ